MSKPYMSQSWRNWITENIRRGVARLTIFEILRKNGFGLGAIKLGMGPMYPDSFKLDEETRDGSGRTNRYEDINNCRITHLKTDGLRKIPTPLLQMYVWENFLPAETCDAIVDATNTLLRKSTITTPDDATGYDPMFRTSETCFLDQTGSPIAMEVDEKICAVLGISKSWSEGIQAQKYSVGQEFKAHTDYFEPGSDEYKQFCTEAGQRTWTFMIYLNEGCEGGATRFRKINKQFFPKKGRAVAWNSMTPHGDPNPMSIHHATKVKEGEKYVITKWFRDKGKGPLFQEEPAAESCD